MPSFPVIRLNQAERPWVLTEGDAAPVWQLPSTRHPSLEIGQFAGKPLVIFFFHPGDTPFCVTEARAFRDLQAGFQQLGANVLGVSTVPIETLNQFAAQHELSYPLLSDNSSVVSRAYDVLREQVAHGHRVVSMVRRTFVIDPNLMVMRVYEPTEPAGHAQEVLEFVRGFVSRDEPGHVRIQAPVLLIPNVLPPELCRHLIGVWETEGHEDSMCMKQIHGKTVGMLDGSIKVRRDHFINDGPIKDQITLLLYHRVRPEIFKAFNYEMTRFEDFRIACYDASRGGYFRQHRDNTTDGTAHRRFAMTLNLNAGEYEGGYVRFPEYGPHLYRPDTGCAVIFSCSLLHEATDVIAGRRFVLLSFFYGEQEARIREEYHRRVGGPYRAGNALQR